MRNIRDNLGAGSVTEELIREVCRAMLEEAKQMYCSVTLHKSTSPPDETEFISPEQVVYIVYSIIISMFVYVLEKSYFYFPNSH